MEERYKYEFLKFMYEKLKLDVIEKEIEKNGISYIDADISGLYPDLSKYFSLVNNVDISRLTKEMKDKHEEIVSNNLQNEVNEFLENSYKLVLFPNVEEKFYFYGPINYNYVAPRDSIVLGFNYREFDIPKENFDELHPKQEDYICDLLNYIQEKLAPQAGYNVAVLKYNEISKKKSR